MKEEEREALLALYPSAVDTQMYVLLASTSEGNKESIAEIFAAAGYTQEDYELDMQLVAGKAEVVQPVFNVPASYFVNNPKESICNEKVSCRYRRRHRNGGPALRNAVGGASVV